MKTVHKIGVGSAFRIFAALGALLTIVIGFFLILLPGLLGAGILSDLFDIGSGFGAAILVYVIGIVVNAIVSGIFGALYAWLYNVAAGWAGGLEIDLSD